MLEEEENSLLFQADDNQSFHEEIYHMANRGESQMIGYHPPGSSAISSSSKATTFIQKVNQQPTSSKLANTRRDRLLSLKLQKLRYQCKLHL